MERYDKLLIEADNKGLITKEKTLLTANGLVAGKKIAIRQDIATATEKACVLAEELGHYHTSSGNILDMKKSQNRKQERVARLWAYNKLIGLAGLINAYTSGCRTIYDVAEYLEVTEEFLLETIECYRDKYGVGIQYGDYYVLFIPNLAICKIN